MTKRILTDKTIVVYKGGMYAIFGLSIRLLGRVDGS